MSLEFSVKELSKLTEVSARNIRYYDSVGLFKPSGTWENGYRFYRLEKIEELRLISYLRHLGISIAEIKKHLDNRDIGQYESILKTQLLDIDKELDRLSLLKKSIENRVSSLDYIRHLPPLEEIVIEKLPKRGIIKLDRDILDPLDWEKAMLDFSRKGKLNPGMVIGDSGFIVNLEKWETRRSTEFTGLYLFAHESEIGDLGEVSYLPEGYWLTLYLKGDHDAAHLQYKKLIEYAENHKLILGKFALERTLIDHFISSDIDLYITEIQIPVLSSDEN